jgi:hypothetical protein
MRFARGSLLVVLALCALTHPAQGAAQVALGLNAGVAFANFSGDDVEGTNMKTGLLGGAYLAFPLSPIFSIAPGAYYVQKGTTSQDRIQNVNVEATLDLAYLEIPVLGVFTVSGPDRPVGVSLFLGPSIAFELSCNVEAEAGALSFSGDCDDEEAGVAAEDRKEMDFGAIFGAGLAFPLTGSLDLTISGGLDMGLTSLDDSADEDDVKNTVWFLTAGVRFPLGG